LDVLESKLDTTVNFVEHSSDGGLFESRYVRREDAYLTCYLSSHSGCVKSCRFCHLTATAQRTFSHATINQLKTQADAVLGHYRKVGLPTAKIVYFSFMARGEPLANHDLLVKGDFTLRELGVLGSSYGLASRFCISTIMPAEVRNQELTDIFEYMRPVFYYSLYSMDKDFRAKWMPQAMDPTKALTKLARWQNDTGMMVKIHGAIIPGENDSLDCWEKNLDAIRNSGLRPEFNLVRYNPHDIPVGDLNLSLPERSLDAIARSEDENWTLENIQYQIFDAGYKVQLKERVGFDVKASCGMFVNG